MRARSTATLLLMIGAGAAACSGGLATTTDGSPDAGAQNVPGASSDGSAPSDASSSDATMGSETDAGLDASPADAAPVAPPPALRLVNLWRGPFGSGVPVNVCAQREGEPAAATPVFATPPTYAEITSYVSVPPGTYNFRIIYSIGGLPGSNAMDCLGDAGITSEGLTGVVVSGPRTLTVHREFEGLGMFAFADTAASVPGKKNIRARNADPGTSGNGIRVHAHSATADLYFGPIQPGNEWPMQALAPDGIWTFGIYYNAYRNVVVNPEHVPGTWDLFTYHYSTSTTWLVACPESSMPTTACTRGML